MINWLGVFIWVVGGLVVMADAPSCPGFGGVASRLLVAVSWPALAGATVAATLVDATPHVVRCKDGSLKRVPVTNAR
jgi:hypothetical protein